MLVRRQTYMRRGLRGLVSLGSTPAQDAADAAEAATRQYMANMYPQENRSDGGNSPEELARIAQIVQKQQETYAAGMAAQLETSNSAVARVWPIATAANRQICAQNIDYPCNDRSPCVPGGSNGSNSWSDLGVTCTTKDGNKHWFPATASPQQMAAPFGTVTSADNAAEHARIYGYSPAVQAAVSQPGLTGEQIAAMLADARAAGAASVVPGSGTGAGSGSGSGSGLNTSAIGAGLTESLSSLSTSIDIAGFKVSPLILAAAGLVAMFAFKGK